jgi:hypothetical protein
MNRQIICKALAEHFGHRNWTLVGDDKVQLDGLDDVLLIADLGIASLLSSSEEQFNTIQAEVNRRAAYIEKADPLFFKAQRGEATLQEWQDMVIEIKNQYPKETT